MLRRMSSRSCAERALAGQRIVGIYGVSGSGIPIVIVNAQGNICQN